jgi:Lrp/AsnC family leucine-responsive transcriptional regulator
MQRKTVRNSFDNVSAILDATNLEILKTLIDDPRIAMSSLARHVGMSAPAVTERVQRLQDAGVIRPRSSSAIA